MAMAVDEVGRRLSSDARNARIAIRSVAYQRQIIGNESGRDPELCAHAGLIANLIFSPIDLHDAIAGNTLGQIFVGGPDADLLDAFVARCDARRSRKSIVGFVFDHRPDHHTHRGQSLFQGMKLRPQSSLNSGAGLVSGPEIVAK